MDDRTLLGAPLAFCTVLSQKYCSLGNAWLCVLPSYEFLESWIVSDFSPPYLKGWGGMPATWCVLNAQVRRPTDTSILAPVASPSLWVREGAPGTQGGQAQSSRGQGWAEP